MHGTRARAPLSGETLPSAVQVYHINIVEIFLRAGVPLNKVTCSEICWKRVVFVLQDVHRSLSDLVPVIWQQEIDQIRQEISGKMVSVTFDGTTHMGKAMAIILRFVTDDWVIQQCLI